MQFQFKVQQYQTEAVHAVVNVFQRQGKNSPTYRMDMGSRPIMQNLPVPQNDDDGEDGIGYKNSEITLSAEQILENIQETQRMHAVVPSPNVDTSLGACSLDVEMETGTGKTYVYIKTIFELHRKYGWSKFIIVVPSIAIREGVKKSLEIMQQHFFEEYQEKIRFFVYNSSNLHDIDTFSKNPKINVMIINTQAFAASLKEGGRSKESRIIYSVRDDFNSRRPIDVIKANRPILILDEPQKMGGKATQEALQNFNPLFSINYSATHKTRHNLVYVLDALDAYNKRLVKKIEVKGFEQKNHMGVNGYVYLDKIIVSPNKPPRAMLEIEVKQVSGKTVRKSFIFDKGDDLHKKSPMAQYEKDFTILDIGYDAFGVGKVEFQNGLVLVKGQAVGDSSERAMRRIQIRETIASHFEKEEALFDKGIKTLSLFFIDEVAKYREYDENNTQLLGEYGRMFEEEYLKAYNEKTNSLQSTPYLKYLRKISADMGKVHNGYFSIDKKTGKSIDSELKKGMEFSDDISAYDLILKNKERLLSFEEPTRFIFSHSALREGWDNPNIFQICTLKHSDSQTAKRQEVGRGLRLCVDKNGNRMDVETLGSSVHDINVLTVVASESYADFVKDLQNDMAETLYDRPQKITVDFFVGKEIPIAGLKLPINRETAIQIVDNLKKLDYLDEQGNITTTYNQDKKNQNIAKLSGELKQISESIFGFIDTVLENVASLNTLVENGHKVKAPENTINQANFGKKEFRELWEQINHKYAYTVQFDSDELINKAVKALDSELDVAKFSYTRTVSKQKESLEKKDIEQNSSFEQAKNKTQTLTYDDVNLVKYDLVGDIAKQAVLTRKTVVKILKGIADKTFSLFKENPEEFIAKTAKIIKEQKASMIVEHIAYNKTDETYDTSIFTQEKTIKSLDRAYQAKKHILEYVLTDGAASGTFADGTENAPKDNNEIRFAKELDSAEEVAVYAKLPRDFKIPTPVGDYTPDWAIAFEKGTVKHVFFIAETKGSLDTLDLRPIEKAKITCAKKLFNECSTSKVRYHEVTSYQNLLEVMGKIE